MPAKDREKRLEYNRNWRARVMPKGYGRWLYAQRKARFEDADEFRTVLEKIATMKYEADPQAPRIARDALAKSDKRHEAVGDPPNLTSGRYKA